MEVTVYGQLRGATGEKTVAVEFEGGTVREAVLAFVTAYPQTERHLVRDDGEIEPSVRIAVDGERNELDDRCPPDASISIHPPMQGG
ncbi:molybdopterin synthase sulfur carrier subunit [Halorientalis sp. IM1011]|uniref:ubiquitin-like small modifier protein 1 n=1 Tax=Halorientalis sp. IM1011 TaxID=1932360 RepID=UPI00097CD216|nr:ubiquitin-like small modifier protein 1 [Halorientalis sp. IM1011]AQL43258.1 molybdopterin synthase sulfur carrier subunit [Halorientalis sp. IM1011]